MIPLSAQLTRPKWTYPPLVSSPWCDVVWWCWCVSSSSSRVLFEPCLNYARKIAVRRMGLPRARNSGTFFLLSYLDDEWMGAMQVSAAD